MAGSESYDKPYRLVPELTSPIQPNPTKSYKHFVCKSLLLIFVVFLFPLIPSQAPEFINQTMLNKVWELVHLLFIGIAVCYGLFSQRHVEMNTETYSKIDNSLGFLQVSSIFDDGFENPCGSDEKRMIPFWNSQYFQSDTMAVITNGSSILIEQNDPRSSIFKNGFENPSGSDEKMLTQIWKSQYFQGESIVVTTKENNVLDHWVPGMDYKPLGLPIRSLKSRNVDTDTFDFINGTGSSSNLKNSSETCGEIRNEEVRGTVTINLEEEKFKENFVLSSPVPWRSRSSRMEMREEIGTVKPPSHSRPLSVGEFEFESLKWQSFQSSLSSQTCSLSSSSKKSPNLKMEDLERKKSSNGSTMPAFKSLLLPIDEASPITSKPPRFSTGSSSEMNVKRSFRDNFKVWGKSKKERIH